MGGGWGVGGQRRLSQKAQVSAFFWKASLCDDFNQSISTLYLSFHQIWSRSLDQEGKNVMVTFVYATLWQLSEFPHISSVTDTSLTTDEFSFRTNSVQDLKKPFKIEVWLIKNVCYQNFLGPTFWNCIILINFVKTSTTKVVLEAQLGICSAPCGRVCFVNIQSSLRENVVFSVCACLGDCAYIIFNMLNSISGFDAWYHFRFNISWGVAVMVRSHQKNSGNF